MRSKSIVAAAFLALAGTLPASAERLFVPMVGAAGADGRALPTEIWLKGEAAAPVRVAFLRGEESTPRTYSMEKGGNLLSRLAGAGEVGLVAIEAEENAVSAWIPDAWGTSVSEVPVIGPRDAYVPGAMPGMQLGAYEKLQVGAANLSDEAASCEAVLFDSGYTELGRFAFDVPAGSLVRQDAAATIGREKAAYAEVGCNRSFYPIGVTTSGAGGNTRVAVAKGIGPNGTCTYTVKLAQQGGLALYTVTKEGLFHTTSKKDPKGIICVTADKDLKVGKLTFEWEVTIAAWSKRDKSGLHNLAYYFLDRYRGGVVGNINAAGPNKSILKFMQNVGMPRGTNTNQKVGYAMQLGAKYRFQYVFDATRKLATLRAFLGPTMVAEFSKDIKPGNNQTVLLTRYNGIGLVTVCEFSNYVGQHSPEEYTDGMKYENFSMAAELK